MSYDPHRGQKCLFEWLPEAASVLKTLGIRLPPTSTFEEGTIKLTANLEFCQFLVAKWKRGFEISFIRTECLLMRGNQDNGKGRR